jgi:hypothetical protein
MSTYRVFLFLLESHSSEFLLYFLKFIVPVIVCLSPVIYC